ncbi:expressed unknown protein [Seminavis robusta]|uniref:Uncharacterized protein n=1 Tax=Seminavis robusta TaxID=568900 RepID=A0A9N8DFF8_9STRA|nr:expressed unknown protein [Seminavis robusta]|eukprot:Sro43_g026360.1 n/a (240) ;mRNA; f:130958-131775
MPLDSCNQTGTFDLQALHEDKDDSTMMTAAGASVAKDDDKPEPKPGLVSRVMGWIKRQWKRLRNLFTWEKETTSAISSNKVVRIPDDVTVDDTVSCELSPLPQVEEGTIIKSQQPQQRQPADTTAENPKIKLPQIQDSRRASVPPKKTTSTSSNNKKKASRRATEPPQQSASSVPAWLEKPILKQTGLGDSIKMGEALERPIARISDSVKEEENSSLAWTKPDWATEGPNLNHSEHNLW